MTFWDFITESPFQATLIMFWLSLLFNHYLERTAPKENA